MDLSALISLIVVLVIVGVVLYMIEAYIPMAAPFKLIIRVVVVLALALYLLDMFGLWHGGPVIRR
jgi:VIT1/CCC1 family predicted Fe2+/Mn2+ transporter